MAASAASPLASSVEKTNGAKLCRLLIDGGTTVLRNIFDCYHPPSNLSAGLNANYSTLSHLLKKKVLRAAQWDQLFPPGGAAPDSNTFDITLLFFLLANICGLTPPPLGWHVKPSPGDISLEANLARVKFYRNEVYGHVSTTGIDTPTFSCLWQEISAVLVALGLDQLEIDKLRNEHCGEEDYLDVLLEWAESEEYVKSQLFDIRRSQTKTQQSIVEVHQTQLEDQKALEDTKLKLKEIHQFQLKDHKTLENCRLKLEEVHRTQINTQQALEKLHQIQDEDCKGSQKTNSEVDKALKTQKQATESGEDQRGNNKEDEILKKLARIDTQKDVKYHTERYQEGTRVSIFTKVENWLLDKTSQNRVMVISGNAGMGKSVISAVVCKKLQEAGRLSGSHFCQHDKARHRNPKIMLQSLACQLCECLPQYKNALVEIMSRNLGVEPNNMEVKDLFQLLFEEPLMKLKDPFETILMVIDGLDESEYRGRNELLDVISNHFNKLPCWIRFLVTTRPEINIADSLQFLNPLQLESKDEENLRDIRMLFEKQLSHALQKGYQEIVISELVGKSEGLILYAYLLVDFIKGHNLLLTPNKLGSTLPSGISSVYQTYFERLENEICKELNIKEERFLAFLSALVAAKEPLLLNFATELMFSGTSSLADRRRVRKAIACISALLPIRNDRIHFFHKSVKDWLTDQQHDFTVEEKEGHRILSRLCAEEFDDVKQKGVDNGQFSETRMYALQHGVQHIVAELEADKNACHFEETVKKYVLDLQLVYAKLCVNSSAASEDIVYVQKQDGFKTLSEKTQRSLETLLFLLRKYIAELTKLPQLILQNVLNEGGSELSAEAQSLLERKYPGIPYMVYIGNTKQQAVVQARFECSSYVACFDVSPNLDYIVCECVNGTYQLWSIHTGRLLWKRPVMVIKDFVKNSFTCRALPFSFYRSVVFHPTKEVVLPGVLSHAYTLDGDLIPLFPESNCSFTICSISGDTSMMLTDCPNNAKCIVMWSLRNGLEITRTTRTENVSSFAWSRDGRLLAISTASGSISLVDAGDGFKTLAETATEEVCGMIKFSSDHQFLFCLHASRSRSSESYCFHVNLKGNHMTALSAVTSEECFFNLGGRCDAPSVCGFLLGDLFPSDSLKGFPPLEFVLDKHTLVKVGYKSTMMEVVDAYDNRNCSVFVPRPRSISMSLDCETVYVVTDAAAPTVMIWDISTGKLKADRSIRKTKRVYLVPVKGGVMLTADGDTPELWNSHLSKCIRSWSKLRKTEAIIPVSEERVACVRESVEVNVIDTASGGIVSTIPTDSRDCVACNRKCQVITSDGRTVKLSDDKSVLWEKDLPDYLYGSFSPDERLAVLENGPFTTNVLVLSADTGSTLSSITFNTIPLDCQFISDKEIVVSSIAGRSYGLQLFNVKSGDLLSVLNIESKPPCLAVCPRKRLVAVGVNNSNPDFKLIQVKLPHDKSKRDSSR